MTKANKNRDDANVKSLLDDIVDPMSKQYVAGNLDEKTRKDLMKFLADTHDPRIGPALAKSFNEYEPGKNEEDVKYAAKAVEGLAGAKKLTDQNVKDALWNCFDKFQVSKTKLFELVKALHDAVVAVSDPSYGAKAVGKLNVAVDPKNVDSVRDHLQFWQLTAVQVVGELKVRAGREAAGHDPPDADEEGPPARRRATRSSRWPRTPSPSSLRRSTAPTRTSRRARGRRYEQGVRGRPRRRPLDDLATRGT